MKKHQASLSLQPTICVLCPCRPITLCPLQIFWGVHRVLQTRCWERQTSISPVLQQAWAHHTIRRKSKSGHGLREVSPSSQHPQCRCKVTEPRDSVSIFVSRDRRDVTRSIVGYRLKDLGHRWWRRARLDCWMRVTGGFQARATTKTCEAEQATCHPFGVMPIHCLR